MVLRATAAAAVAQLLLLSSFSFLLSPVGPSLFSAVAARDRKKSGQAFRDQLVTISIKGFLHRGSFYKIVNVYA